MDDALFELDDEPLPPPRAAPPPAPAVPGAQSRPFGALAVSSSRFLARDPEQQEEKKRSPPPPPPPAPRRRRALTRAEGEENAEKRSRVVVQAGELDEEARWRSPAWQAGLAAAGAGNGARVLQHSLAWVRLEGHWRRAPLLLAMVVAVRATHHDCAVELADPTGRLGAVVHREAAEPRAAELQPGAVLLLRAVSCFSAAGAHHLNVVPSALAALFPATTASGAASGAAAIDSLPADWRGLDSYVRVPTRPKRPSSSSSSSFGARRGPVVPAPIAPTAPPERSAPAPGVAAARRALLRIPTVPNVRVPEILPPKPLPEAPAAAPATPGWNDADNALLLEYARLAEKSVSANGLRNSSSSVSSSSLSPAWNDEDDARLLELDLDTLVTK